MSLFIKNAGEGIFADDDADADADACDLPGTRWNLQSRAIS